MAIFTWAKKLIIGSSENTFASGGLEMIKVRKSEKYEIWCPANTKVQKKETFLDSENYSFTLFHYLLCAKEPVHYRGTDPFCD